MLAIFLDIETTGLDPLRHKVIDIAFSIVDHATGKQVDSYQSLIKLNDDSWAARDLKSIEINGYSWDDLQQGVSAEKVAEEIIALFTKHNIVRGKAVFICQNPAFDRVFFSQLIKIPIQEQLLWPYHWLDLASMYWALKLKKCGEDACSFPEAISLSKNAIAESYQLAAEPHPHRALNGVHHLVQCYQAVLGISFVDF